VDGDESMLKAASKTPPCPFQPSSVSVQQVQDSGCMYVGTLEEQQKKNPTEQKTESLPPLSKLYFHRITELQGLEGTTRYRVQLPC